MKEEPRYCGECYHAICPACGSHKTVVMQSYLFGKGAPKLHKARFDCQGCGARSFRVEPTDEYQQMCAARNGSAMGHGGPRQGAGRPQGT